MSGPITACPDRKARKTSRKPLRDSSGVLHHLMCAHEHHAQIAGGVGGGHIDAPGRVGRHRCWICAQGIGVEPDWLRALGILTGGDEGEIDFDPGRVEIGAGLAGHEIRPQPPDCEPETDVERAVLDKADDVVTGAHARVVQRLGQNRRCAFNTCKIKGLSVRRIDCRTVGKIVERRGKGGVQVVVADCHGAIVRR